MNILKSLRTQGTHMVRRQIMIWDKVDILSIGSVGTKLIEIPIEIHFSTKLKTVANVVSKIAAFWLRSNVLSHTKSCWTARWDTSNLISGNPVKNTFGPEWKYINVTATLRFIHTLCKHMVQHIHHTMFPSFKSVNNDAWRQQSDTMHVRIVYLVSQRILCPALLRSIQ